MSELAINTPAVAKSYVRLSETVLFLAPKCYGSLALQFSASLHPDFTSQQCHLCAVFKQCESNQEVVWR